MNLHSIGCYSISGEASAYKEKPRHYYLNPLHRMEFIGDGIEIYVL
jgi:hypothetical protein